jgi:NADPH:quinone reductase-like Zn-dependent oxidoreductase
VTTARAVGITRPGGPEVLAVVEREVREPGPGEIRLAVRAAAVNPTDVGLRERGADGLAPPWVPGMDAAGVVESVGEGVERLAVGDRAMAAVSPRRPEGGAQAELVVVPAASVVPVPDGMTMEQAATLPMNGLTALHGLDLLGLHEGQTLAVTGGAGVLASYVIPIARRRCLRVLADASPDDEPLVRGFGADVVLPRGDALVSAVRREAPDGVDAVFDTALLRRAVFPAVREGGAVAVVRTWDGDDVEQGIRIARVLVATALDRTDWLEEVRELATRGVLVPRAAGTYPPERAAAAHERTAAGGLRGRAVIVFGGGARRHASAQPA